jgi:hypothetical protein
MVQAFLLWRVTSATTSPAERQLAACSQPSREACGTGACTSPNKAIQALQTASAENPTGRHQGPNNRGRATNQRASPKKLEAARQPAIHQRLAP